MAGLWLVCMNVLNARRARREPARELVDEVSGRAADAAGALVQAWAAAAKRYEWWPKALVCYGAVVAVSALPLLWLEAGGMAAEILSRFAGEWYEPPVRTVLREFAQASLVIGIVTGGVAAVSIATGLGFLLLVRAAGHRGAARLLAALRSGPADG